MSHYCAADTTPAIGIIGAGPAGCALSCFLALRGISSIVFDNQQRPDLIVGESLISAAVPLLQRLGIERELAQFSKHKPGAALRHSSGARVNFRFQRFGRRATDYAYNIPRPAFDRLLRARAEALGVRFVQAHARFDVHPGAGERDLSLCPETLVQAGLMPDQHPAFLVDATGRSRAFSRLLEIESLKATRDDVAYFAHFKNFGGARISQGRL